MLGLAVAACRWETGLPDDAAAIPVDPARSLVIEDRLPSVTLSAALRGARSEWRDEDFRLLALVNRTDLSDEPDRTAEGGEGRLVFGHRSAPMTIAVEYTQPGPARTWAARWQALTGATSFDRDVAALVDDLGPIAQVRTADATDGAMILREYAVRSDGLEPTTLRNQPDYARIPATELTTTLVPREWCVTRAVVAPAPPGVPAALVDQTCTGCHLKSASHFQIDPATGALSTFLSNPGAPADELRRREAWLKLALAPR